MKILYPIIIFLPILSAFVQQIHRESRSKYDENDTENSPCNKVYFNSTSFACKCDETYCDKNSVTLKPGKVTFYISDKDNLRFNQSYIDIQPYDANEKGQDLTIKIPINSRNGNVVTRQKIVGFGGAITDATAIVVNSLSDTVYNHFMDSYFNITHGNHYEIVRNNMAGCDFSVREYTYCDTENDFELNSFRLAPEDVDYKIPIYREIREKWNPLVRFFASPWTAPSWMKTNHWG